VRYTKHKWLEYYFSVARFTATMSKDPSTKLGAVIVGADKKLLAIGYNGFLRAVEDDPVIDDDRYERPYKYLWTVHAEIDAIFNCARNGICTKGASMLVPWYTCSDCAGAIIQAGISELYCTPPDFNTPVWGLSFRAAEQMYAENRGVQIHYVGETLR